MLPSEHAEWLIVRVVIDELPGKFADSIELDLCNQDQSATGSVAGLSREMVQSH